MKKNLIVTILLFSFVLAGAFAVTSDSFDVTTAVSGINQMKLTASAFPSNGTPASFTSATAYAGTLAVTTSGTQSFSAYLSTISNNRKGYSVTMSATALKSTLATAADAYINYTVSCNTQSVTTNGATATSAVTVVNVPSLSSLASQSHQIGLSVDSTSFDAAVEGSYSGTVTFTYTAN